MLSEKEIKDIIMDVFPNKYLVVGETKVEHLIAGNVEFDSRESESGMNSVFLEYTAYITTAITTLKQIYDFLKEVRKDIRKKTNPDDVLKELKGSDKLSDKERRELIEKALELLENKE
jgi:hypothetical protein